MTRVSNTIIYFIPHQDDELLSMGVDICDSLKKRKNVHIVLCTDGSGSSVRKRLNNGGGDNIRESKPEIVRPQQQGYRQALRTNGWVGL